MKEIILTSSALILAISLFRILFRNRVSHRLQYALWGLVALRLLIPLQFGSFQFSVNTLVQDVKPVAVIEEQIRKPLASPSYDVVYQEVSREFESQGFDVEEPSVQTQVAQETAKRITLPTWGQVLHGIWIAGIAVMAIWFLAANLRFDRNSRRHAAALKAEGCPVPVYVSESIGSPCLTGLFRPRIYLTPGSAANAQTLRHVLIHELTHLRHGDHIWSTLRCLCLCIYWFNPLVWMAAFLSRRDCELACDEGAIAKLGEQERLAYGKTLLDVVSANHAPNHLMQTATAMNESKKQLTERVKYIVKKPKFYAIAAICLVLVAAVTVGCTFTGAEKPSDPQESTAPDTTTVPTPTVPTTTVPETTKFEPPSPTGLSPLPENYDLEDLVSVLREVHWEWHDNVFDAVLPYIRPFSSDAIACQDEINQKYLPQLDEIEAGIPICSPGLHTISYDAYLNNGILSLIIAADTHYDITYYDVYNFDLETGESLTTAQMAQRALRISYPEFLYAATRLSEEAFFEKHPNASLDEHLSYRAFFDSDTQAMTQLRLYIAKDGQVMLRYDRSSIAGADYYPQLTAFGPQELAVFKTLDTGGSYDWLFNLQTDGAYTEAYTSILAAAYAADPEEFTAELAKQPGDVVSRINAMVSPD